MVDPLHIRRARAVSRWRRRALAALERRPSTDVRNAGLGRTSRGSANARRSHLAAATRQHAQIALGASPRAALALTRAARARAYLAGRGYVLPDDVQALAASVLSHRLLLNVSNYVGGRAAEDIVRDVVATVPAPREAPWPDRV
jgi:MoxR-like ATPase